MSIDRFETLEEALNKHQNLFIEGGPGWGKSTQVRNFALTVINKWFSNPDSINFYPIVISAKKLSSNNGGFIQSIHNAIQSEIGKYLFYPIDIKLFLTAPARDKPWLVLLDGLDELVSEYDRRKLLQEIKQIIVAAEGTYRFVITTRPISEPLLMDLDNFGFYSLALLNQDQIDEIVSKWFYWKYGKNGDRLTRFLGQVTDQRISDLLKIPLLLTMALILHDSHPTISIPTGRFELFNSFIRQLLEDEESVRETRKEFRQIWDNRYGFEGSQLIDKIFNRRKPMLEAIVFNLDEISTSFDIKTALEFVRQTDDSHLEINDEFLTAQITEVLMRSGLVDVVEKKLYFIHNSFYEFLLASAISKNIKPADSQSGNFIMQWSKTEWREIVFFVLLFWHEQEFDINAQILEIASDPVEGIIFCCSLLTEGVSVPTETYEFLLTKLLSLARRSSFENYFKFINPMGILGALPKSEQLGNGLRQLFKDIYLPIKVRQQAAAILTQRGLDSTASNDISEVALNQHVAVPDLVNLTEMCFELGNNEQAISLMQHIVFDRFCETQEIIPLIQLLGRWRQFDQLEVIASQEGYGLRVRLEAAKILSAHDLLTDNIFQLLKSIVVDRSIPIRERVQALKLSSKSGNREFSLMQVMGIIEDQSSTEYWYKNDAIQILKEHSVNDILVGLVVNNNLPDEIRIEAVKSLAGDIQLSGSESAKLSQVLHEYFASNNLKVDVSKLIGRLGMKDEAVIALLTVIDNKDENPATLVEAMVALKNLGVIIPILPTIREILSNPGNYLWHQVAINALLKTDEKGEVAKVVLDKSLPPGARGQALEILREIETESMQRDIFKTLSFDVGEGTSIRIKAAKLLITMGETAIAREALLQLIGNYPVDANNLEELVQSLLLAGCVKEACQTLIQAVDQYSINTINSFFAIRKIGELGMKDILVKVFVDNQYEADIRFMAIKTLFELGDVGEYFESIHKLLTEPSTPINLTIQASEIIRDVGLLSEANKILFSIAETRSIDEHYRINAIGMLYKNGMVEAADKLVQTILKDDSWSLSSRENLCKLLGELGHSIQLTKILQSKEYRPQVRIFVAHVLYNEGIKEVVAENIEYLVNEKDSDLETKLSISELLFKLGHTKKAAKILLLIAQDTNITPDEEVRIVETLLRMNEIGVAQSILSDIRLGKNENPYLYLKFADLLNRMNSSDKAVQIYVDLVKSEYDNPFNEDSQIQAAGILRQMGKHQILLDLMVDSTNKLPARIRAANALLIGNKRSIAIDFLTSLLKDPEASPQIRVSIISALSPYLDHDDLLPVLKELVFVKDVSESRFFIRPVYEQAIKVLKNLKQHRIILELAEDSQLDIKARFHCVMALCELLIFEI